MSDDALRSVVGQVTQHARPATLAAALVAAVAEIGPIPKSREVRAGARRFEYADLGDDILPATRPALAAHGLAALQELATIDGDLAVTTIVVHSSGETMRFGPLRFDAPPNPQDLGALVTYARRYCLLAALGIGPGQEADVDSHEVAHPPTSPPRRAGGLESSSPPGGPEGRGVVAGTAPGGDDEPTDAYLERRMAGIDAWRDRLAALDGYDVTVKAKAAFVQVGWHRDWHPTHTTLGILEAALKRLEPEVVAAEHDRDGTTVDPPAAEPVSQDPYEGWTLAALRAEARRRGLVDARNLTKLPLIALLHDFDERMNTE